MTNAPRRGRSNHYWESGERVGEDTFVSACRNCALAQRTEWWLDEHGRPATGLIWATPGGRVVAVNPFKHNKNHRPITKPIQTWAEAYPDAPIAGTPQCPKSPEGWLTTA